MAEVTDLLKLLIDNHVDDKGCVVRHGSKQTYGSALAVLKAPKTTMDRFDCGQKGTNCWKANTIGPRSANSCVRRDW